MTNFDCYAVDPAVTPMPDFFLDAFDEALQTGALQNEEVKAEEKAVESAEGEGKKMQQVIF